MGFDITRQNLISTIVCFVLMSFVFISKGEITPYAAETATPALTSLGEFFASHVFLRTSAVFLLVFINAFYITRVISRNLIFVERTYMPALIYLIISLGYPSSVDIASLLAGFLTIFAAEQVISSFNKEGRNSYFFNASLALGIASVIYAPAAVLLIWLLICLILFRRSWREWAISLVLFSFPLFVVSYIEWGSGGEFSSVWHDMSDTILFPAANPVTLASLGIYEYILIGLTVVMSVLSIITIIRKKKEIRKRSAVAQTSFIWLLIIAAAMFVLPCRSFDMLPVIAVPLSVIIPAYFNRRHGLAPNIIYGGFLLFVLVYNILILAGYI